MNTDSWSRRQWAELPMHVGPCAWSAGLLLGPDADWVRAHPSLIVVDPDADTETLEEIAPRLAGLREDGQTGSLTMRFPIAMGVTEPAFARRLPGLIAERVAALGLDRVELLVLWIDDPADLKGGALLQGLRDLRDSGAVGEIGLGHHNPLAIEWMAINTAARALAFPYHLHDQAAGHRAIRAAREHAMACLALQGPAASDPEAMRFALGRSDQALPVMAEVPRRVTPMTKQELVACWQRYQADHPPPPPLHRGQPPVV